MDNLVYAKLPIEFKNFNDALSHYISINDENWFWDVYREVRMLPLYTPGGAIDKNGSRNKKDSVLKWTKYADKETINFFEESIFPWLDKKGRIILLKTPPGESLATHIDCNKEVFGTRQHKLRVVLQGTVNSLTFVTKNGDIQPKDNHRNAFIMDGSWPHYMTNTSDDWKYTICLGSPWDGGETTNYVKLLNESNDYIILDKNYLPENYTDFFEDKIKREEKFKK